MKLVQLAVDRHSFSFPATFIRAYGGLGTAVRLQGLNIVADFLERKGHRFDNDALNEIISALDRAYAQKAFKSQNDLQHVAAKIVLPIVEKLTNDATLTPTDIIEGLRQARHTPIQVGLKSLLVAEQCSSTRQRAIAILVRSNAKEDSLAGVIRSIGDLLDADRGFIISNLQKIVEDENVKFFVSDARDDLSAAHRQINWSLRNVELSAATRAALAELRRALVARQVSAWLSGAKSKTAVPQVLRFLSDIPEETSLDILQRMTGHIADPRPKFNGDDGKKELEAIIEAVGWRHVPEPSRKVIRALAELNKVAESRK